MPLFLLFFLPINLIASESSQCNSRSLVQTQKIDVQNQIGWQIEAKKTLESIQCRAEKIINTENVNIIYSPTSLYQGYTWYFGFYSEKYQLSEKDSSLTAQLFIDDKAQTEKVTILRLEGFKQGKTIPGNIRSEYFTNKVDKLKNAKKIHILAKPSDKRLIKLHFPELRKVIEALEKCHLDATKNNSQDFWKNSTEACG